MNFQTRSKDITNNDMHVIEDVRQETGRNMASIARKPDITVDSLTFMKITIGR